MVVRNRTLKPELIEEIEFLNEKYFPFDEPVPFLPGLTLYPVSIKNHNEFLTSSSCCTLDKQEDIEGIGMSHLDFLISKINDPASGRTWGAQFSRLVELVFQIQNGIRCGDCEAFFSFADFAQMLDELKEKTVCPHCGGVTFQEAIKHVINPKTEQRELLINGVIIGAEDFERFRQIVMYQNLPDFKDDSWVDPELREDQKEKQRLVSKQSGSVTASLEKKIVCVSAKTSYKFEDLYQLSIRKFLMLLTAVDDALAYEADRVGLMTGMVSSKKPLEHWIYKKESSMYGEAVAADVYYGQINSSQS